MEIKIKRTIDFTPEWEDNKKADSPIVFHLRYLSVGEMDDCISLTPKKISKKGKVIGGGEYKVDRKQMFSEATMSIDNLSVDDGEKKTAIDTPELLLVTPGLDLLYYEASAFVSSMNARIDSKN